MFFLLFIMFSSFLYAQGEGTTTIPPSELIITGSDKYYLEFKEELPDLPLVFPLVLPPSPSTLEKEDEKVSIKLKDKEKFVIKERPPKFLISQNLPWIEVSLGNYNFLGSSLLFAKEKGKKGGFLLIERKRQEGFSWNNKNDFYSQNKDKIELFLGSDFNEARTTLPLSFLAQEVFLPYEQRNEKRNRLHLGVDYETPFYNNLMFSGSIDDEKKDIIKNRSFSTRLSFDFAKKNRLNIFAQNDRGFEDKNFLKCFFLFYPTKKQWKHKDFLIKSHLGLSCSKDSFAIVSPEAFCEIKSRLRNAEVSFLFKNYIDFKPFSLLYFETLYSTVSTSIKPERVLELKGGIEINKEKKDKEKHLSIKNSLFLCLKDDTIEWYKKAPGLYAIRNSGSLFSFCLSGGANYLLKDNLGVEFLLSLMGLSKDINYTPKTQGEIVLKYNNKNLLITPKLIFKGEQKTDASYIKPFVILNISGKRRISDEFEAFFDIENLFNNEYMEMEDYPGGRLFVSLGLKIRL